MKRTSLLLILFIISVFSTDLFAQKKSKKSKKAEKKESSGFTEGDTSVEVPQTVDLDKLPEEEKVATKKKRKKNVYYGIKTKKHYAKTGFGNSVVYEIFHYLKEHEDPDKFVREIYWYDFKSGSIKKSRSVNKDNGVVLHGPYKKMLGDKILEEGIFYKGTKHGRWMTYNKNDILMDKRKYFRGWPKEAEISYYDKEQTKLKEVVPIQYGTLEGTYFLFHDNGQVAVTGKYENGEKVGVWRENYKYQRKRKKLIQYSEDSYDMEFQPFILKEWNSRGKLLYDKATAKK